MSKCPQINTFNCCKKCGNRYVSTMLDFERICPKCLKEEEQCKDGS